MKFFVDGNETKLVRPWFKFTAKTCLKCRKEVFCDDIWQITRAGKKYYLCESCAFTASLANEVLDSILNPIKHQAQAHQRSQLSAVRRPSKRALHLLDLDEEEEDDDTLFNVEDIAVAASISMRQDDFDDSVPIEDRLGVTLSKDGDEVLDANDRIVEESRSYRDIPVAAPEPSIVEDNTRFGSSGGSDYDSGGSDYSSDPTD